MALSARSAPSTVPARRAPVGPRLAVAERETPRASALPAPLDSALQVGVWRYLLGADAVVLNAIAGRLLGLPGGQTSVPLTTLMAAVHPQDRARLAARARAPALRTRPGEPRPIDLRLRDPERPAQWLRVRLRPALERSPNGQPLALLGICVDITGQHAETQRNRTVVHRYEAIGQAAGVGFWSLRPEPGETYWGLQMFALHELPEGEPPPGWRRWLREHVVAADRALVRRSMRDWMRSGQPVHELSFRVVGRRGRVREVVAHARMHEEGGSRQPYGLLIDVTDRNRAEREARRSAEKTQLIARSMGLGTWEHDLISGEVVWDEQMWRLRGREPREVSPSLAEGRTMLHPDDRSTMDAIIDRSLGGHGPHEYEFRVLLPDGATRWLASRSVTECDDRGVPCRRIGINWDVTEARLAHVAREERVAAQRELKAKAQFLSRMSHELRTPLNAVLGFAQLLRSESGRIDEATRRGWIEQIEAAGQHLAALIDDVLDLSSMEGGEVSVRCAAVPLPALVASVLALVDGLAREYGVAIELGDLDVEVWADSTRLRQVLLNLISNAIKYNRRGGRVHIAATSDGTRCTITVVDNGRGLTGPQLAHLFEPFNRLGAENSEVPGNGIGLAIAKALVERMDGTVTLRSQADLGTTVELSLRCAPAEQRTESAFEALQALDAASPPAEERAAADAGAPPPAAESAGPATAWRGRLLYVEDNPVNAMIVSELVSQYPGVEVRCCETGADGIATADRWQPDLILLDMQLPDMTGDAVFAALRRLPQCAQIPCIALSANAVGADIERALRSGFAAYWTKPLDFTLFHGTATRLFRLAA